jgi:uncharacterized membrane protein
MGRRPLVDLLGLAFLAPAALLTLLAGDSRSIVPEAARDPMRLLAGVSAFVFVSLEVRRAFVGPVLSRRAHPPGDGEIHAYSAVWIVLALGLLAVAVLRRSTALRCASLAVLVVTVPKVFLYDMSDLTGLLRVASFLGLGLTPIGIGWVYRTCVLPAPRTRDRDE